MPMTDPKIRRKSGDGYYQKGDRVIATDYVGGKIQRVGTVGGFHTEDGKKYMVIRYGDEPFLEAFICRVCDIVQDLPDDSIEAIEEWLEQED